MHLEKGKQTRKGWTFGSCPLYAGVEEKHKSEADVAERAAVEYFLMAADACDIYENRCLAKRDTLNVKFLPLGNLLIHG